MRRAALAALVLWAAAFAPVRAADPAAIVLHRIAGDEVTAFATGFFYKRHPHPVNWSFATRYRSTVNWSAVVGQHAYMARADLDGDGTPELILVVDDPDWCEADGCLGDIFRKVPRGYELICETALPQPAAPAATILPEIENGYHQLATPNHIVVWNRRQDYDSGALCATESRND
jgi:hypothetical protein